MQKFLLLIFFSVLAGCSTYSKHQCESSDWYQVGYNSAREGETLDQGIQYWSSNCTDEHHVQVDQQKFTEGFNKGLEYLCTETQGRLFGQTGHLYRGTCPKEKEASFQKTYESGRMDFLVTKVSELEEQVRKLSSDLSYKDNEIMQLRSHLNNSCR